jgi:hypothetical protein
MTLAQLERDEPNVLPITQLLLQFSFLQLFDFLTTVAFLVNGIGEANPLVRNLMTWCPNPLIGLAVAKSAALALALYCWRQDRLRLLTRANLFFSFIVTWNLLALILGTAKLVR